MGYAICPKIFNLNLLSITQTGILTLTLKLSLISCIPGFLITKFVTNWTKSGPGPWIFHENFTVKICKCNLVTEIKIIKSISYTISAKKAGFREFGTLIALNITKANRRR